MSRIVIFANGVMPEPERVRALIGTSDVILCADGGTRHALALGLKPNLIIGDLDSMEDADRQMLESADVPVRRYSHDKNETDLELAMKEALAANPSGILVVGGLGKRLDHTLGNISLLCDPAFASLDVRLDDGLEEVFFCRGHASIQGSAGDLVSLLPWGGAVEGIHTDGLQWPLHAETLLPEKTRGISNEMLGEFAAVSLVSGMLLIIHRRQTQAANRLS